MSAASEDSPGGAAGGLGRAEKIFFEVVGLSAGDRGEAIARLAAGDEALRQQVLGLVEAAGAVGGFLEQPALGALFTAGEGAPEEAGDSAADELIGQTLGAFRLEKRIASGGMGTVYLASRSDDQFDQRVAIKVVKRGMDSEEIVRRFREERQTLAQLDHPYIARLLDGGMTGDGRPYLIMEYVDGLPIDRYCDAKRLSTSERLKLFRMVCEGVHAAHQSLVIHRDLKPSNILVSASGVPKLLDFGIAKLIGGGTGGAQTAEGERRLTPEYASPEQVRGDSMTTASDVYSLGVILYELLCGVRPYSVTMRSGEEVRRVVCDLVPRRPSEAVTVGAGRLRTKTAVSDGMASGAGSAGSAASVSTGADGAGDAQPGVDHPRTRGVSSTRLRGQLRGDLDNIVLMALRKEPQRRYASAEQFAADIGRYLAGMPVQARRDTWLYRSGKFVRRNAPAVVAGGLAVVLLAAGLVIRTQQRAEILRQRDEILASNSRLEETRGFLVSLLSGAQASGKGPSATLGEVLADAAMAIETTPMQDDLTLASVKEAIGTAMMTLGMTEKARPLLEAAMERYKGEPPESSLRMGLEMGLAQLLYFEGKPAEAEAPLRDLLRRERARNGGVVSVREGDLLNALGAVLRLTKRYDEAIAAQREALAIRVGLAGAQGLPAAESHNNIATTHLSAGRPREAVGEYERAMAIREAKLRPGHPMVVATQMNLGLALLRDGQAERARPLLIAAAIGWEQAYGPEHPGQVFARTALGQCLVKLGERREAVSSFELALAWQERHNASAMAKLATRVNITVAKVDDAACDEAIALLGQVRGDLGFASLSVALREQLLKSAVRTGERCGDAELAARSAEELAKVLGELKR